MSRDLVSLAIVGALGYVLYQWFAKQSSEGTGTLPPPENIDPPDPTEAAVIRACRADLGQRFGLSDAGEVVSVNWVDWPDSGLGCTERGVMYAQVVIPGAIVRLRYLGKIYTYHTTRPGSSTSAQAVQVKLCSETTG